MLTPLFDLVPRYQVSRFQRPPHYEKIHWLDVHNRVTFKLEVMVHRCLNGRTPRYLAVHCDSLSSQRHLRLAERNLLHVPRHRLSTYTADGLLPLLVRPPGTVFRSVRNPTLTDAAIRRLLKTFLSAR